MKTLGLNKIEEYFNLSFTDVINILHWEDKRSIKSLSDECGISRDTFQRQAKKRGLPLRSNKEACKLTTNKGANHWGFGLTKETHPTYKAHSDRMIDNNPACNNETLRIMAVSKAEYLKKFPSPQEKRFKAIIDSLDIEYIFQYPLDRYVIDFFIPDINLCIEIDSVDKWGSTKRKRADKKISNLNNLGYKVLSIPRLLTKDRLAIIHILQTNNIIK